MTRSRQRDLWSEEEDPGEWIFSSGNQAITRDRRHARKRATK